MADEEMVKLLKEIKDALKAEEGYFIYTSTSHTTALENLLAEFPLRYIKSDTLMADLFEYIIICKNHVWTQLRDKISQSGFKAYCSTTRLPVSGTIGTINAVAESANVNGYDASAADWKAIYATSNSLWVRLKAEDVGLLKPIDLDIDANKRLGVRLETDSVGLATESTLSAINSKITAYDKTAHALQISVTTTATQIVTTATIARYARLQALNSNTDVIRIGDSANQVYEIAAGKEIELYDVDLSTVYVVSTTAGQILNVIYVT